MLEDLPLRAPVTLQACHPFSGEEKVANIGALSTRASATIGAVAVLLSGLLSLGAGILSADIAGDSAGARLPTAAA